MIGWSLQVGFWTQCDITDMLDVNGGLGLCYQAYVEKEPDNGALVGVSGELVSAKVAFGYLMLFV